MRAPSARWENNHLVQNNFERHSADPLPRPEKDVLLPELRGASVWRKRMAQIPDCAHAR